MATDLGTDISCYPDYDPLGTMVSGYVAMCQRICRRLTNPRGSWSWAPNECTDIRSYLNDTLTKARLDSLKSDIERECSHEEAVVTINASILVSQLSFFGQTITIHIDGTTGTGPFSFVLALNQVTLAILKAG